MAIVRCPRCRDEVSVPPGATTRALVRCPLCLEQYLLSEALANAPPLLVIIGGEVPQAMIERSSAEGHAAAGSHDYQLAETFAHSPDSHWGHAAAATLPRRAPAMRRGRKREPNAVVLGFSWLGGGALSLVLAPLILWWIFRIDPVEIGPTVAAYAPWVVPQQFHANPATTNVGHDPASQSTKRLSDKTKAKSESEADAASDASESPIRAKQHDIPAAASETTEFDHQPTTEPESAKSKLPTPNLTDLLP